MNKHPWNKKVVYSHVFYNASSSFALQLIQFASLSYQLKQAMLEFNAHEDKYRDRCKSIIKRQVQAGKSVHWGLVHFLTLQFLTFLLASLLFPLFLLASSPPTSPPSLFLLLLLFILLFLLLFFLSVPSSVPLQPSNHFPCLVSCTCVNSIILSFDHLRTHVLN